MFYNCIVVLRFVVQKGRVYDSLLEIIDTKTLLEKVIPVTLPECCGGESYLKINFIRYFRRLSQVDDFSSWTFLAVEIECAVRNSLGSEVTYRDGTPGIALSHLDN